MRRAVPGGRAWAAVVGLSMIAWAASGEVKSVVWSPHGSGIGCRMNMGPTGASAWMRGYQFEVMTVDAESPADGILLPGDRVVGAGGTVFSPAADSRMTLGNAIGRAEAKDGALSLTVLRDGRKRSVTVRLPVMGGYSGTWPYDCAKSQRILHEACTYLLDTQLPNGEVVTDGGIGTFFTGLLLLASGEPRFMDGARRAAYATAAMDLEKADYHCWGLGYGGLLLAEYYLATGDGSVLPRLQASVDHLARGQMRCGSWGHIAPSSGYGALNQAGIVCAITMSLARECGVKVDIDALNRAMTFYGRYAELGSVPYGDHAPGIQLPDDNGKSASTAVLCTLDPRWQGAAPVFGATNSPGGRAAVGLPVDEGQVVSRLVSLLTDSNAWVRCRAAAALGALGKPAGGAAAGLVKAVADPDAWVRSEALNAIGRVTEDRGALMEAALEALKIADTSFSRMGSSLSLIEKSGPLDASAIPSLVFALEHPGEGSGAVHLARAMQLLVDIDPGGTAAVPAITKVAGGGYAYDRLVGNPRQAAIELLGKMGPKASGAVPVLQAVAAGTDEKQKALREAARAALGQIGKP